ncbi:uncharacterized protein DFL_003802 [Arthrobotrys flagrans]|uniref:Uncharacterized protein n=1 Tax=Arthrobotrys flagrans TaxID=97331 RepID=A0A437A2X9_ARTFL|nr:hypothetical protein DFL_003802 [Arthrobotrys flagrans]
MCRKVTYHKSCEHVTSRFQRRPCKNDNYCPRITQELNADDSCGGCLEDAQRVTERPIRLIRPDYNPRRSESAKNENKSSLPGGKLSDNEDDFSGEEEFYHREAEWFRRHAVDFLFDEGILTAQYMDQRASEMKESRGRRAGRAAKRVYERMVMSMNLIRSSGFRRSGGGICEGGGLGRLCFLMERMVIVSSVVVVVIVGWIWMNSDLLITLMVDLAEWRIYSMLITRLDCIFLPHSVT